MAGLGDFLGGAASGFSKGLQFSELIRARRQAETANQFQQFVQLLNVKDKKLRNVAIGLMAPKLFGDNPNIKEITKLLQAGADSDTGLAKAVAARLGTDFTPEMLAEVEPQDLMRMAFQQGKEKQDQANADRQFAIQEKQLALQEKKAAQAEAPEWKRSEEQVLVGYEQDETGNKIPVYEKRMRTSRTDPKTGITEYAPDEGALTGPALQMPTNRPTGVGPMPSSVGGPQISTSPEAPTGVSQGQPVPQVPPVTAPTPQPGSPTAAGAAQAPMPSSVGGPQDRSMLQIEGAPEGAGTKLSMDETPEQYASRVLTGEKPAPAPRGKTLEEMHISKEGKPGAGLATRFLAEVGGVLGYEDEAFRTRKSGTPFEELSPEDQKRMSSISTKLNDASSKIKLVTAVDPNRVVAPSGWTMPTKSKSTEGKEGISKARDHYDQARRGLFDLLTFLNSNAEMFADPTGNRDALSYKVSKAVRDIPLGLGEPFADLVLTTEKAREYQAISEGLAQTLIYSVSGAQAPDQEVVKAIRADIPRPGNSPEEIARKLKRIETRVGSILNKTGTWRPPALGDEPQGLVQPVMAIPMPEGGVIGGERPNGPRSETGPITGKDGHRSLDLLKGLIPGSK